MQSALSRRRQRQKEAERGAVKPKSPERESNVDTLRLNRVFAAQPDQGAEGVESEALMQDEEAGPSKYIKRAFVEFIKIIARAFFDDACVILLTLLAVHEKAFTESDLKQNLNWRDDLLQSKLVFLSQQLVITSQRCMSKGSRTPLYWCISPTMVTAIKWHCDKLLEHLRKNVQSSEKLAEFQCPSCMKPIAALDIMSGPRRLSDGVPLCPACPKEVPVVTSQQEVAKTQAKQHLHRAEAQLGQIYAEVRKVRHMEIPKYDLWTRAMKNDRVEMKVMQEQRQYQETAQKQLDFSNSRSEAIAKQANLVSTPVQPVAAAQVRNEVPWFAKKSVSAGSGGTTFGGGGRNTTTAPTSVRAQPPQQVARNQSAPNEGGSDLSSINKKRSAVSFSFGGPKTKRKNCGNEVSSEVSAGGSNVSQGKSSKNSSTEKIVEVGPPPQAAPEKVASPQVFEMVVKALGKKIGVQDIQSQELEEQLEDDEYELYHELLEKWESSQLGKR